MTERELVQAYRGCSMESRAFAEASDAYPWDGLWPVIGGDLCLTGEIADAGDAAQYLNYRDVAMIRRSDAASAGWRIDYPDDGYAEMARVGVDSLTGAERAVRFNVPGGGEWVLTRTGSGWTHPTFGRSYPHLRWAMAKARALAEKGGAA